jgi:hypothetical protein
LRVNPLSRSIAVVDERGRPTQELNLFSEAVAKIPVIIGTGSPEGIVEAMETRLYMDSAGATGTILYIKQFNDIGGDRKLGWILV